MIRRLLSIFTCQHATMLREREEDGSYWLACSSCGYRVPALQMSAEERDEQRERYRIPLAPMARKVPVKGKRAKRSNVEPFARKAAR